MTSAYKAPNVVPDFSSLRLTFPFIDHLNDGYSCFRYISYIYLSELAPIAIQGYGAYNVSIERAVFDPPDAPFRRLDASRSGRNQLVGFDVYAPNETGPPPFQSPPVASVRTRDHHQAKKGHYGFHDSFLPLAFYKNVTNQPWFGKNESVCDNMKRYWNTSLSKGRNKPRDVKSSIRLGPPLVPEVTLWKGVGGVEATDGVFGE